MSSNSKKQEPLSSTAKHEGGISSIRTTSVFRLLNFELYTKPNKIIMGIGLACFTGVLGYVTYMRFKYESMGYYTATTNNGEEHFIKKESKWET